MPNGRREVLGVATAPSEAETFRAGFLRSLADRGLRGVKLVIADDHCQSACKTDPLSASKIDPPMHCRDQGLSRRN
jgi:hypothetical protein